jgi:hypothetical protein
MTSEKAQSIFISYSHKDRQWLEELMLHLAPFEDAFDVWSDSRINAGENWEKQISNAIERADVAIILVSANYLTSSFIEDIEVPAILNARQLKGTLVLPILISPCMFEATELSKFQFLNSASKPLSSLRKAQRDAAYVKIAEHLHSVLVRPETKLPGPTASTDFADDIARRVFNLIKADMQVNPSIQLRDENENEEMESKLVFVICSFSSDMEPIYEGIKEAAHAVGLDAKRVKDVIGDYQISNQIMSMIAKARLIVADLTHERPNVYFELGYARGIGKTIVTCAREGTDIHFDVKDWTYIPYSDSRILERELVNRFRFELEKGA